MTPRRELILSALWPFLLGGAASLAAQPVQNLDSLPPDLPDFHWHLTARPWQPVNMSKSELLGEMDKAMHAMAPMQRWNTNDPNDHANGALIDPYDKKEIQYATPMFAFNVATLLSQGYAPDLVTNGARALDRATWNISTGYANDGHGEFFSAPMVKAIRLYEALQTNYPDVITPERLKTWKERMTRPREDFMYLRVRQNWRTFAMDGEWLRQADGYITNGVDWIELNWTNWDQGDQRERFREDLDQYHLHPYFFLYHDNRPNPKNSPPNGPTYSGADPQTFTYNGAATANLLDMLEDGYTGPSAGEMMSIFHRDLRSSLLLMSASGEAPAGGRTGEHSWDDTIYAEAFELMAQQEQRDGDLRMAGEFQHAAQLLLKSHERFQQENGLFSITKNLFPAALKNHYASWSGLVNYEGFDLGCCSATLLADKTNIVEQPAPAEIGGYAVKLDPSFANVFLNAGGMQAQIVTRGEVDNYGGVQWHTLGITRFSRAGWDGRLGPGAGGVNPDFSDGISFSPVFFENGKWTRVCTQPRRFQGNFKVDFVHPLLVRGTYTIAPGAGQTGPTFQMRLTLTPDGVLVDTARISGDNQFDTNAFGVIWPLFKFDGRTILNQFYTSSIASTAYPRTPALSTAVPATEPDQQNFIALKATSQLDDSSPAVRTGYGDYSPIRVTNPDNSAVETFVYPRSTGDPDAESVRASFVRNGDDFSSVLGWVKGTLYRGRTSAGGVGRAIDLDNDGRDDVIFNRPCAFILQLKNGRITAIETDRVVTANIEGRKLSVAPYMPVTLD
jgi:hypothetical protein